MSLPVCRYLPACGLSLIALLATAMISPLSSQAAPDVRIDSLVLERGLCYGTCAAYRLSISSRGRVVFTSRKPGDSSRKERGSIPAHAWIHLALLVREWRIAEFPGDITKDRSLCPSEATDHPPATVTVFSSKPTQRIDDYLGCFTNEGHGTVARLDTFRFFERAIDSIGGSRRWVRPAVIRP
jgi:Domain of unknown function (DUF6438)